jgi:hypothetical protein
MQTEPADEREHVQGVLSRQRVVGIDQFNAASEVLDA